MYMRTLILLLLTLPTFLFANTEPVKCTSKIQKVTVFKNGAQVTRIATINLLEGKQILQFIGLPPSFDEKSLQVKATGNFTILAVQHQINLDTQTINRPLIRRLKQSNDSLTALIDELELQHTVLAEEEALILNNNKNRDKEIDRLPIAELKQMAVFYRTQLKDIRLEKLHFRRKIAFYQQTIQQQTNLIQTEKAKAIITRHKEIWVSIMAKSVTKGDFEVSYLVNNAGWIPTYDIRVIDVQNPIDLSYKANVFQNSGEDWENVKLTLSNADPRLSGEKPVLNKWNLGFYTPSYQPPKPKNYQPTGISYNADGSRTIRGKVSDGIEPLIGASVLIKGTNTGTATDLDGKFEITIPEGYANLQISYTGYESRSINLLNTHDYNFQLEGGTLLNEVIFVGSARKRNKISRPKKEKRKQEVPPVTVTAIQKTTSVEFEIKEPYTIKKDGEKYMVTIQQLAIPAYYEYYCAPKIEEAVFLTAMISDWEQYNLLSGETNLYFEGTFLGNANLDVANLEDTISLSLGRDKNILVERNLQKDYTKKQFIGNKKMETKAVEIEVRNKKKQPINLVVEDHFPVALTNQIEVKSGNYKGAALQRDTKILQWQLRLAPSQTKKLTFDYSVKYPKYQRLVLD